MNPERTITYIPATKTLTSRPLTDIRTSKIRVCAYARVSTDQDEQQSSYAAQIKFYSEYIKGNPAWEFVGVYADEGISGTNTKKRDGFNRMIEDAQNGKIDLILTKSISRFARNTLDTIRITRELKAIGVEIYFEKENLKSMDPTTEVQLTILASLAQDESRSLSQNISWGIEKRMRAGKFNIAWSHFLGYDKGPDGLPVINEEESKIIRIIYDLYMSGRTMTYIASYLTERHIKTPGGNDIWSPSTIRSILSNEKYKGDAIIHKTFTVDYLTKDIKKNEGEVPQYYVANSHPAIISPADFDTVQSMLAKRSHKTGSRNDYSPFNDKIKCNKCGSFYTKKTRNKKGSIYTAWNCTTKFNYRLPEENRCQTKPLHEEEIINGYLVAINQLLAGKAEILPKYAARIAALKNRGTRENLARQIESLENKLLDDQKALHNLLVSNTRSYTFEDFERERCLLSEQAKSTQHELDDTKAIISNLNIELVNLQKFLNTIKKISAPLEKFQESTFLSTIEEIIVSRKTLTYIFYDGSQIKVPRDKKEDKNEQ